MPTNLRDQMNLQPKQERITRTYTIDPVLYRQVRQCVKEDGRILSRIIEKYLTRYLEEYNEKNK